MSTTPVAALTEHSSPLRGHCMPFGAQLLAQGGVEFRLWAPAAQKAGLRLVDARMDSGEQTLAAQQTPGGWWQLQVAQATPDTLYQWVVDVKGQHQHVPDPAARHAPEGPHGLCAVGDPARYSWHRKDWQGRSWCELVFYELHVGTFTSAGTYTAAAAELPRLAALGFTAIELMPLATFGGAWGWGYDGVLPFAPHPRYGTPEELKYLVDAAHALGLCVFLDVVYNHFGPDGNYLPLYAPSFFSTRHDSPWGPAINFDREGCEVVREFFIHNALYWLEEFHMDGLRLDAVHAIADESQPDILQELHSRVSQWAQAAGRRVHLVLENEKNQTTRLLPDEAAASPSQVGRYDAQWNDDFHHALHVALTGESQTYYARFSADPVGLLARVFTHGFAFPEGQAADIAQRPVPLTSLVHFVGNHDQIGNRAQGERLSALVDEPVAELALLLALLTPATPLVFMGDEFGATTPFLYFAGWEGELREAVRAGRQREFGLVAADGQSLPDPCSESTLLTSRLDWVQAELPEGRRRSELLRQALDVRRQCLQPYAHRLQTHGHMAERVGERGLRVGWRYQQGRCWWLEMNLGPVPIALVPPQPEGTTVFQHGWASLPDGAPAVWQPWSARWTCTEGTP
ncbi:malto-oligosyltrehalose trehalohydrolase [Acidovorax sp. DW039]|uniref:malto-oligosyltrehalose trehalohydrolase n=1 Tax=Acidovorax sp. DW039 TaxID=3095606 RepID=UPI0030873CD1|nr:malto-oligosyltrehalose trehalohydrolase [Acidovorax sp. DW039]